MSSFGTGLLAAFGGATEGAGKAMGDQARANKKATTDAAKAKALEEKEKNLVNLRNTLSQQSQDRQNTFDVSQQGSGQFREGHQLTKAEFEALPKSERQDLLSTEAYGEKVAGQKFANEKELLGIKIAGQKDIAGMKAASSGNKGLSVPQLKFMEDSAMKTLTAKVEAYGGIYDPDSRTITVPIYKNGQPKKEIFGALSQSGFGFTSGKPFKEDKKGLFTGDDHYVTIHIEDFSPDRKAIGPQDQGSGGGDTFGELLNRAKSKNKGQQGQAGNNFGPPAQKADGGLLTQKKTNAADQGKPEGSNNQAQRGASLPKNPLQWNVKTVNKNGKPTMVAMIDGAEVVLTDNEVRSFNLAKAQSNQAGNSYTQPTPEVYNFPGFKKRPTE